MTYTLDTLTQEEKDEQIVQQLHGWERDLRDHQNTLTRFKEILKDPDFDGSTMKNNQGQEITFRQKIEAEIPVLEGRIAELNKLIEVVEQNNEIPPQKRIDSAMQRIKEKEKNITEKTPTQ